MNHKLITLSAIALFTTVTTLNPNPAQAQAGAAEQCVNLKEQLGDELFDALANPANAGKVREFARTLVAPATVPLPTAMTVGGRKYDLLGFLRGNEEYVKGDVMVARAKEMNAHLGQDEAEHLLANQDEIPSVLRGKVYFVFPDWRLPGGSDVVACVCWSVGRWVQGWDWLGVVWVDRVRLLRRK